MNSTSALKLLDEMLTDTESADEMYRGRRHSGRLRLRRLRRI